MPWLIAERLQPCYRVILLDVDGAPLETSSRGPVHGDTHQAVFLRPTTRQETCLDATTYPSDEQGSEK